MKNVIWINGPFGAGKTTLVNELKKKIPNALIFDPERFGFMVQSMVSEGASQDFQDLPIWRRLVPINLLEFIDEYDCPILVPMTLVNPSYLEEIFGTLEEREVKLRHFFLKIERGVLTDRINSQIMVADDPERDEEVRNWRLAQIDRCLGFLEQLPSGTKVLDSGSLEPKDLAAEILRCSDL